MATTSPNNIRTPDLGDSYNLVPDLQTMANDTQDALIERANAYKGTTAQRTAFTSQAEDGVLWQDTNGDRRIWVKHGSSNTWRAVLEDTGWVNLFPASGVTGTIRYRVLNRVAHYEVDVTTGSVPAGEVLLLATGVPAAHRPSVPMAPLDVFAGNFFQILAPAIVSGTSGNINVRNPHGSAYAGRWMGTGSYALP